MSIVELQRELACWPTDWRPARGEDGEWYGLLAEIGVSLYCLGTTADGSPKHPLARGKHRIPADQQPMPWSTT